MIGLFIKDFHLLKRQVTFFLFIIIVAVFLALSSDASFIIGYMTFIGTIFTLSTISYDEFDNGNAFLFTLPISRKNYVLEKYLFGIALGSVSWILAMILSFLVSVVKKTNLTSAFFFQGLLVLLVMLILLALMIPFQLKFGGEKGRIAIIGTMGVLFVLGIGVTKIFKDLTKNVVLFLQNLSPEKLLLMTFLVSILALLISVFISYFIMMKKEF